MANCGLFSLQKKNYKAVCMELKPELTQVSYFEVTLAARTEIHGEVIGDRVSFYFWWPKPILHVGVHKRDKFLVFVIFHPGNQSDTQTP